MPWHDVLYFKFLSTVHRAWAKYFMPGCELGMSYSRAEMPAGMLDSRVGLRAIPIYTTSHRAILYQRQVWRGYHTVTSCLLLYLQIRDFHRLCFIANYKSASAITTSFIQSKIGYTLYTTTGPTTFTYLFEQ